MAATCISCDCGTDTGHDAMQLLDLALLLAAFLGESICRARLACEPSQKWRPNPVHLPPRARGGWSGRQQAREGERDGAAVGDTDGGVTIEAARLEFRVAGASNGHRS
jgi:hypothetical protein